MKQLGNLALVCAKRDDVCLSISGGEISVFVDRPDDTSETTECRWNNDEIINGIIRELNFGRYRKKEE